MKVGKGSFFMIRPCPVRALVGIVYNMPRMSTMRNSGHRETVGDEQRENYTGTSI